jgi:hypothetical protein
MFSAEAGWGIRIDITPPCNRTVVRREVASMTEAERRASFPEGSTDDETQSNERLADAVPEHREYQQEKQRVDEAEQDKPSADPGPPTDERDTGAPKVAAPNRTRL